MADEQKKWRLGTISIWKNWKKHSDINPHAKTYKTFTSRSNEAAELQAQAATKTWPLLFFYDVFMFLHEVHLDGGIYTRLSWREI